MEEKRKELMTLLVEKQKHQAAIQELDEKINAMLFELIEPEKKEPDITQYQAFVRVKFNPNGREYDYLWNQTEPPGEQVIVDSIYDREERVIVVKCFRRKTVPQNVKYKEARPIE